MEKVISEKSLQRLHIGGLTTGVTIDELKEKFNSFGTIQNVEVKTKKDIYGDEFNTFAYIDIISDESALNKCFSIFNKAKWKGRSLQIQIAKEHFLKRLDEERKNPIVPVIKKVRTNFHDPLALLPEVEDFNIKGKVPGTPIPGEKKWVVGKYGRVLPIVNVRNRSLNKCIYYDPSKYCHNLKKLKVEEDERLINIEDLTWNIDTDFHPDSLKRRCGDFSDFKNYVPKRVKLNEDYWSDDMQEKMEELRRRYLEKNSEKETLNNIKDDIEIVKSGIQVASEYHIPKTDFIYGSDEELSHDEEQFQYLSVIGETTSGGYDSAGSADTDEIIAMNTSKKKTSDKSINYNGENIEKDEIIPIKRSEVNQQPISVKSDKLTSNSKFPVKTQLKSEMAVSYVDNSMKPKPFGSMAMLDHASTETVINPLVKGNSDSESKNSEETDSDDSYSFISKLKSKQETIPIIEHTNSVSHCCSNDSEYDSDDFEKVALKYFNSFTGPENSTVRDKSNLTLEIMKNEPSVKTDMLDTDDMTEKQENIYERIKPNLNPESESNSDSDDTVTNIRRNDMSNENDTSSTVNNSPKLVGVSVTISKTNVSPQLIDDDEGSHLESDIEIIVKDRKLRTGTILNTRTIPEVKSNICKFNDTKSTIGENSEISNDPDDQKDDVTDNVNINITRIKTSVVCNKSTINDESEDEIQDDAGSDVNKSEDESYGTDDSENSNDDSDEGGDGDDDQESDGEDVTETNSSHGNEQKDKETDSSDDEESEDNGESDEDGDKNDDDESEDDDEDSDKNDDENKDDDESEDDDENEKEDDKNDNDVPEENQLYKNKNFFVSSSLFSAFVKPEKEMNSGFSFLKTFGNKETSEPKKFELPKKLRKREDVENDISDEVVEKPTPKSSSSFFFQPKDIRLQEGVQFFHRKMDIDEIENIWNEEKPVLLATCRQRNRLALKRKDQEKLKKRKTSFTTSFMSKNKK